MRGPWCRPGRDLVRLRLSVMPTIDPPKTTLLPRGPRGLRIAGPILLVTALAAPAEAQMTGDSVLQMAGSEQSNLPPDSFGGNMMFGRLGEDFFLTLALRLNFDRENWGIGLQLPVRIRLTDNENLREDDYFGFIRRQDWDQPSDYLRLIRYVYIGQRDKKGPFYVRLGELPNLTVGHGTIMHRYFNVLDVNQWHTGINAAVNIHAFGAEVMLNDVANPYVAGARFHVRPLKLALGEGFWEKLYVGASVFADARAPFELGRTPMGAVAVNDNLVPEVTRERALAIAGIDVGIEILNTGILSITPYTDLNKMNIVENGWGWHTGVLWKVAVPLPIDTLVADLRTEYRRVSGDYLGPYFNTVYEIERYQRLNFEPNGTPKLRSLCGVNPDCVGAPPGKNGLFFELLAGLPSLVFVGGEYIDYDGGQADGSLRLSLEVPALEVVRFSAFYYRINVDGVGDLFALDDKSAIVAQAMVPLYGIFSVNLRWWRVWQGSPDVGYQAVDDWSVGVGFNLAL